MRGRMERGAETVGGYSSQSHTVHLDNLAPEKVYPAEGIPDSCRAPRVSLPSCSSLLMINSIHSRLGTSREK